MPIQKEGISFTLEIRFATQNDVKDKNTSGKDSKFYRYTLDKRYEERRVFSIKNI